MLADQSHYLLHAVIGSQDERYAHDLVPAPELADEFPARGILEYRGGGLEVLGEVFQRELGMVRTGAEQTLGAGHLFVEQLVPYARRIAVADPQGTADGREQDSMGHGDSFRWLSIWTQALAPRGLPCNGLESKKQAASISGAFSWFW
jgi:hypothetical protein